MSSPARTVVITGASRGLGLAAAAHLHRHGWHVVGAMRSPEIGLERIRAATGAPSDDPRLAAVRLDLADPESIEAAATAILETVGAPFGVVHNAGITSVGCVEELPPAEFERIFATNVFGPNRLTAALLPSMRAAGRGRVVIVSSEGSVQGMPAVSAYAGSKAALERWGEALSAEVAPFGIGVTVLVAGMFDTDILSADHTVNHGDPDGPYGQLHAGQASLEEMVRRFAGSPERFSPAVERALDDRAPFARRGVGPDAVAMRVGRALLSARVFQRITSRVMRIPAPGALRDDPIRFAAPARDDERG